jgi:hypothetical protein
MKSGDGAHRGGRATVGRRKAAGVAVFNGGGVAPVVVDVRGGVLQHRCGRGKMGLAPIWEWRSSEGAHRRGGRRRRRSAKSDVRERPPVAGGGGTGAKTVGREAALERGAGAGSVLREWTSGRGRALSGSVGGAAERERKERERRGPDAEVPRGAGRRRGAWPQPCLGRPGPDRVPLGRDPDATRAGGALLFGQRRAGTDRASPSGSESREARVGRPEKKAGWPSPDEQ